jgi:hypothetical protein
LLSFSQELKESIFMKEWIIRSLPGVEYEVRKVEFPDAPPVVEGDTVSPALETPALYELAIKIPEGMEDKLFLAIIGQCQGALNASIRAKRPNASLAAAKPAEVVVEHVAATTEGAPPVSAQPIVPQGGRMVPAPRPVRAALPPRPQVPARVPGAPPRHSPPSSSLQRRPPGRPPNEGVAEQAHNAERERRQPPASPSLARRGGNGGNVPNV